jgi:hypothetical protein
MPGKVATAVTARGSMGHRARLPGARRERIVARRRLV